MVIQDCLKQNARKMILDLSGVDYIDSSGIGIVAWCAGRMKEAGGKLMIVGAAGRVLQLLKMTQVDSIVPVFETLDAALAAMSDGLAQPPATT
jgi:anti-sigma B factor antagonist